MKLFKLRNLKISYKFYQIIGGLEQASMGILSPNKIERTENKSRNGFRSSELADIKSNVFKFKLSYIDRIEYADSFNIIDPKKMNKWKTGVSSCWDIIKRIRTTEKICLVNTLWYLSHLTLAAFKK